MRSKIICAFVMYTFLLFSDICSADPIEKKSRQIRSPIEWPSWEDVGKIFSPFSAVETIAQEVQKAVEGPKIVHISEYERQQHLGEEDYCARKDWPQEPTFAETRLRISDRKCLQWEWKMNIIQEFIDREKNCSVQYARRGLHFVLGGNNTKPGEFPHMAAIGWKAAVGTWIFKCGGTLISPKFVLTAAHCMATSSRDTTVTDIYPKIVRLGDRNILDYVKDDVTPVEIAIERRIPHHQYSSPRKYFDIALLELQREAPFHNQVHPACLSSTASFYAGTKSIITGWGVVKSGSLMNSPELQKAEIDLLQTATCTNLLRSSMNRLWGGFADHQICAGVLAGGIDSCQGDSGGPLQMPTRVKGLYTLVGVTSFGRRCGVANSPGVYTRVVSFLDWIEQIVWPGQ